MPGTIENWKAEPGVARRTLGITSRNSRDCDARHASMPRQTSTNNTTGVFIYSRDALVNRAPRAELFCPAVAHLQYELVVPAGYTGLQAWAARRRTPSKSALFIIISFPDRDFFAFAIRHTRHSARRMNESRYALPIWPAFQWPFNGPRSIPRSFLYTRRAASILTPSSSLSVLTIASAVRAAMWHFEVTKLTRLYIFFFHFSSCNSWPQQQVLSFFIVGIFFSGLIFVCVCVFYKFNRR